MHRYSGPYAMPVSHGFGWVHLVTGLAWTVLLVILVMLAIRALARHNQHLVGTRQTPLEIAKARYAKGELTKAEFESLKKDLAD